MIRLAFCDNNGGGDKSTLVFHLAHMLADLGHRTLLVDFDPQSSLTAMCVQEDRLGALWPDEPTHPHTIVGALVSTDPPHVESLRDGLGLVAGDLGLSSWEGPLSEAWLRASSHEEPFLARLAACSRVIDRAAQQHAADVVLIDVGPSLGAITRAALWAADHVVSPIAPDPYAIQGLRALGPVLAAWRSSATKSIEHGPTSELARRAGAMAPLGYVVMQGAMRLRRPAQAYERWVWHARIEYYRSVLEDQLLPPPIDNDPWYLGTMRHYHALAPLARDAGKPMFHLRPADGATGSFAAAAQLCREEFEAMTRTLLVRAGLSA